MSAELTPEEITGMVTELSKRGGERGRAIFYRLCFLAEDDDPEFVVNLMQTVLPQMPERDREIVLYVLDEHRRAKRVDFNKIVDEEMDNAVKSYFEKLVGGPL